MNIIRFIEKVAYPFRFWLLGILTATAINALDIALRPYLTKLLIDAIADKANDEALKELWRLAPIYVLMQFLPPTVRRLEDFCSLKYEPAMKNYIVRTLMERIAKHSYTFFHNNSSGSLISRVSDIASMVLQTVSILISYIYIILGLLSGLYILAGVHIWFALGIFLWTTFFILISALTVNKSIELSRDSAEASSRVMGYIIDFFNNISNIRLFAATKNELKNLDEVQEQYLKTRQAKKWFAFKISLVQWYSFAAYQGLCLIILIKLYSQGLVSAGDFTMTFIINIRIIDCVLHLSEQMRYLSDCVGTISQGLKVIYQDIEISDHPDAAALQVSQGVIEFKQVQFRYQRNQVLFDNKSVLISAKQRVGLVGYSGSGKSSFINLILRLFNVDKGQILIDGQDIAMVTQDSLHANISIVTQEPTFFNRSILENIRYGKPEASDDEVITAAQKAQAHAFIMQLPQDYHTIVGEGGTKLSGGQKQRIALARAVLKQAKILILDEATSQLDAATESSIINTVEEITRDKTTLVIAHRFSTLRDMDRILVFDQGKITQDGHHEDLIKVEGLYSKLWHSQVGGFLPTDEPDEPIVL